MLFLDYLILVISFLDQQNWTSHLTKSFKDYTKFELDDISGL